MNENEDEKLPPPTPTESPPDTEPPDTIPETREGRRRSSHKFRALFGEKMCMCPGACELHPSTPE